MTPGTPAEPTVKPAQKERPLLLYAVSLLLLGIVVYVRLRHLSVPLERDEGEYAYMGQLLLKGIKPFTLAYSMKPPGTGLIYALFMQLFGQTAAAIRGGLLLVNLASILLVYLLARRHVRPGGAVVSAATFALLSLSQSFFGMFAHATHFVVIFALAGLLLLETGLEKRRTSLFLAAGLCLGCALLIKQHAAPFILLGCAMIIWECKERRFAATGVTLLLLGAILPWALLAASLRQAGVYPKFLLWTVLYAREYLSAGSLVQGITELSRKIPPLLGRQLPLWLLTLWGGSLVIRRSGRGGGLFVPGLTIASLIAVCLGWYFREHYFIMLLPALSLLAGVAADRAGELSLRRLPEGRGALALPAILALALSYGAITERAYFFTLSPREASLKVHGKSPFPAAVEIGAYLKARTTPDDRIGVLGSEPEIYFYADRLSATGHIYMYSLMENHPYALLMQEEMIRELSANLPSYLVMVRFNTSWGGKPDSSPLLLNWAERLLRERYDTVGIIDVIGRETTRYRWDRDVAGYPPQSDSYITVHRLRTSPMQAPPAAAAEETQ